MSESRAVAIAAPSQSLSVFSSETAFESAQRMAKALCSSTLVPDSYRGGENMGNALVAMDMARRMNLPPMTVMQNLHVIEGRPSWASTFIISALASCGLFGPLRWREKDLGEQEVTQEVWTGPKGNRTKETRKVKIHDKEFVAYATELATGEVLEGPPVSFGMAVKEGWYFKPGSKWQTMPDLMGRYRSAAFFGRLYAPHILNGMQTQEEILDVGYEEMKTVPAAPVAALENKPEGRASGLHAAMNGAAGNDKPDEKTEVAEPKKPTARRTAKPVEKASTPEPEQETEEDAVDAEFEEVSQGDGEDDAPFGPEDSDDDFQPA